MTKIIKFTVFLEMRAVQTSNERNQPTNCASVCRKIKKIQETKKEKENVATHDCNRLV